MKDTGRRGKVVRAILLFVAIAVAIVSLAACTLADPDTSTKYQIINNEDNVPNLNNSTRTDAIDNVTNGLDSLRAYLNKPEIANTGYYMGVEFNINTEDTRTHELTNFRLKIQAHLYTYKYQDDDGNLIYKYFDKRDNKYYDAQNAEGTRERVSAEDIHNEAIKKSDILIEWYDGISNQMLIGLYYDGINGNSEDPGNIMYLNIQGAKRSFLDWGDTVLYRQLIRLLMSLSIEKLMIAANIQGDSGTSSIRSVFELLVTDNYKTVLNGDETSTLFYDMNATPIADTLTNFIQGIFRTFRNDQTNEYPLDPFTNKYLGFKFSVMGAAVLSSIATDMQFFTQPDPTDGTSEILTGAHLTFDGAATSLRNNYTYVSDATFEYGAYPPEDIPLDRDHYTVFKYGKYEFTGNLYVPLINGNFDALIRTDMQQYYNYQNNIFMEYTDIANGELMMGMYYRGDIAASPDVDRINKKGELVHDKQGRTFIDISGMEYLYGWIDLNQLGFPKVYDEHINMADQLDSFHTGVDNGIISIVDSILSPDKNDKENMLMTYIMRKMSKTEKIEGDIFSRNTETLLVDMELVKQFLRETGVGDYTTRQVINILDSMLPYTMDQIAIMLGVANAEIMLDNSYFTFRLDVDTNEIRICMYTNVNRTEEEGPLMIFQLDLVPVIFGNDVNIANLNFENYKPLDQIYTYSATMDGNFIFSTAETVDLSKLLSATIGENSGLNTPYTLEKNAGITFRLIYDQFVTDHEIEGVMRYQGRSAFELNVWLTGAESSVIIRLASDDVAFNNDVYNNQPERANELGYVWVSIECVNDNGIQRIPKVKIREDVFMSSMQAYFNGTKISDNASDLGRSEVNLSITSILFALIEDSYVVMEPEQMEITSSNETLQNLFRVKGLIGNIRTDAGFRHRVSGLQSIRDDYGLYQVGQFENLTGNSPYDTELHHTIPVYFYEDYINYHFIKPNNETFDTFTPNKTSEGLDGYNLGQKPKGYTWASAASANGDSERSRLYGIYNAVTDSDEKLSALYADPNAFSFLPENFNVRAFLAIDGENSLVMSNKTLFGQHYTKSDDVIIESATYYKVTFKAKTLLSAGNNAEFRFFVNGTDGSYQSILIDSSKEPSVYDAVEYTIYIDNPTKDYYSATWAFYLGDSSSGVSLSNATFVTGMMVVDDILFCSVEEEEFLAAAQVYEALDREGKQTARTRVYTYPLGSGTEATRPVSYDPLRYDLRVDKERGTVYVYEKGGRVSVYREPIEYANDSFFVTEDANNQDISKVRFKIESLPFVYKNGDGYCYVDYEGEEIPIGENYVRTEGSQTYVYFLGVQKRVQHRSGDEYCYYDGYKAVRDENDEQVCFYTRVDRKFLFEYDEKSIEITEQAKTQYAPRINGSFMGEVRRYVLVLTSPLAVERGKLIELYDKTFYSVEDETHSIQLYDDDGVAIGEPIPDPIVLFVMEPCEPLSEEVAVNIQVNNNTENYVLPARFEIDWDSVTLKGDMVVTEVVVAPGMMGEQSFPVRIIVTNREINPLNDDTVSVYVEETDHLSESVPVVDSIEIDPYDYIIAKNEFFSNINNYNPGQLSDAGEDPQYLQVYREKEAEFVKNYFARYTFSITFRGEDSLLYAKIEEEENREKYVAYEYSNENGGTITTYDWAFDAYSEGNYTEDKIKAVADGGATHTALYLHTYFKGQLIALQVNVMTRKLVKIKFIEDDDYDPTSDAVNAGKEPGDSGYVYGHYIANYFDEASYTVPTNPIFVFTDGAGHTYEKIFDMAYISGLATNGSYVINEHFGLTWGNPYITYIGANGSYYYKEVWCVDDRYTADLVNGKIVVEYCDDNVVASLVRGGASAVSNHTDASVDATVVDDVKDVTDKYDTFFSQIAAPATGTRFYSGDPEYVDYTAFFNEIKALFDNASNTVSHGLTYQIADSAVIGIGTDFSFHFRAEERTYEQWLTIASRLFGFDDSAEFVGAVTNLAAAMTAATPENVFAYDGAVYTADGYFMPYAFSYANRDTSGVVLGALMIATDGTASLWLSDGAKAATAVNLAGINYGENKPTVRVYGRCQLMEFGKVLVNRPFDISHVVRDENGNVLDELAPEERYDSDVTSASINWFDLFTVYKPEMLLGEYQGSAIKIHLIAGDETYNGFMTTVVRVTVECPKLDVANIKSEGGDDVVEADDLDIVGGHKALFTPSYVDFGTGTNPGYYFIDPLDASTLEIPSSITIGFTDETGSRLSSHVFVNIQWRAAFEKSDGQYVGEGSLTNASGVQVIRYDETTGKYYFNQPTDEPLYTKLMAKIGSELSGYQYVTVCVRVLSKDPQEVEFYYGQRGNGTRLTSVERSDIDFLYDDADKATEFAFYTYYVDTFADFKMPTYIKAYFGVSKERSAYYDVTWRAANGAENVTYNPNSIRNMVAEIGTGDIVITIYLSVVVANYTIREIALNGGLEGYYVRVGTEYRQIAELLQASFGVNPQIGLYYVTGGGSEQYVYISTQDDDATGIVAGKIPLYSNVGGNYVLRSQLYPYEFIEQVFSVMNIYFNPGNAVTLPDVRNYTARFRNETIGQDREMLLSAGTSIQYVYDASSGKDKWRITFKYEEQIGVNTYAFFLIPDSRGIVKLSSDGGNNYDLSYTLEELAILYSYLVLSERYDDKIIASVTGGRDQNGDPVDINGIPLREITTYDSGNVTFTYGEKQITFSSVTFEGESESVDYSELVYRIKYLSKHRRDGYSVSGIENKRTVINDYEGIFYVNDVVQQIGKTFIPNMTKYSVSLGTGAGAYDIHLKLGFEGGYRMTVDSETREEIAIRPYTRSGYAQYGEKGFIFGEEVSATIEAVAQDGRGVVETFRYGPNDSNKDPLNKWYVESSTFEEIVVGTFITSIPQSVIYSSRSGVIEVSSLTKEGFRINRILTFDGVPTSLDDFDSTNQSGLVIVDGNIEINDIYQYTPMTTYFTGSAYLPSGIQVRIGTYDITINNVNWQILESWYGLTVVDDLGRRVGVGELDRMTYNGTYNPSSGTVSPVAMATADILGWADAEGVYHDRITITLTVTIDSAEIVGLPWSEGALALDTRTVVEDNAGEENYRFYVDVDAYNDASSSAISEDKFILPKDIVTTYRSGRKHTFQSVTYRYNDLVVTSIPYNLSGIDTAALALEFGVNESYFPNKDHIDLSVNVGLDQVLKIRFKFYDKTVETITAVLEPNDTVIREQIRSELTTQSTDKGEELLSLFNTTRIKYNVESMYAQARTIRERMTVKTTEEQLVLPTANDILSIARSELTVNIIKSLLYNEALYTALVIDSPSETVSAFKKTPYNLDADWNFALEKIRASAFAASETYATVFYEILRNDNLSDNQRRTNVTRQMENFLSALFNNGYDGMIGDYLKLEMAHVFTKELNDSSAAFVNYASAFKNEAEGSFDYDAAIHAVYRFREMLALDKRTQEECATYASATDYAKAVLSEELFDLISAAITKAGQKVSASDGQKEIIVNILRIKMGIDESGGSRYHADNDVKNFVRDNYTLDKKSLRIALRDYIGSLFDFDLGGAPYETEEIDALIPILVEDNVNAIQNYSVTVGAIRRNLNMSVDITSMLNTLLSRGVKNFVDEVYMESVIVSGIKRAQSINLQSTADYGYYYIDPYYDFRMMPTKVVVSFGEEKGGFDHTETVSWLTDPISGKVAYNGNKKLDWFGYMHTYYNAYYTYATTAQNGAVTAENDLLREIMLESVLPTVSGKTTEQIASDVGSGTIESLRGNWATILNRTWAQLRANNALINDVMESIESYASSFYGDVTESNREDRYIELYLYYRAGQNLLDPTLHSDAEIENAYGMDAKAIRRDYDKYRYDDLNANLYNANTKENQVLSLIVEVRDRTLTQGELVVLDDEHNVVRSYSIDNPFEASTNDIPNKIRILVPKQNPTDPDVYEYLDIIWNNVQLSPTGNYSSVASGNNYIHGYIGNTGGQEVTLQLFIDRWEYAGVYEYVNGNYVLMNTGSNHVMDFYFNEYLTYSADESYQVRFKVYDMVQNGKNQYEEEFLEYRSVLFYPEDSALLVNSSNDDEMAAVVERKKYVMYWDEMAVAQVLSSGSASVTGSLFLGNDAIGKHNVTTLSTGSTNTGLAKTADYHYEQMRVDQLAVETLSDVWQYSVDGTATCVTDPTGTLPETGKVKLFNSNIDYDMSKIEVRVLWNRSYSAAINALINFIEYSFPEVESAARSQYAKSLLLDEWATLKTRTGDVYEKAKAYVVYRNPSLTGEDILRAADQLLMVNERYDYTKFPGQLRGGSYANGTVDIVVRYADSADVYVQEGFRVRLVFADFSPVAYYYKDNTGYHRIDSIEPGADLTDLYIGVRKKYWYPAQGKDAYTVEGAFSPYDNVGNNSYKLLEEKYDVNYGTEQADGLRLVHVTDIVYESDKYRSESFTIDGVTYRSDMIYVR